MKKLVCMALSAALLAGSMPAYAADYITKVPHTFTAKVGTMEFTKDGTAQPLDVAIYTKNGYTMLPLRTFMNAVLQIHPKNMIWDGKKQTATVLYGAYILIFDLKNNTILKNGEALPVWGKMEVKDGRVFVPLRNWSGILQSIGYLMEEGDITWDSTTKLATVRAVEQKLDPSNGLEKPALSGKGAQASYAVAPSTQYDEIEPLGDGYFLAQKYMGETNVGLGQTVGSDRNVRYLLDHKGTVLQTYNNGTDNYMEDGGERTFLVGRNTENGFGNGAIDWEGKTVIPFIYNSVEPFSEGLAAVSDKNGTGFVNRNGEVVIPLQFEEAEPFSDGLAVVKKTDGTYAYIDKTGKIAIDASQYSSVLPFYEGLAMVRSRNTHKAGFIDKTGKEVIPCQYRWAGYFRNGVTYASDAEGKNWLIDKTGKKLKLIAEGNYLVYVDDDMSNPNQQKNGVAIVEDIVDLPNGEHDHVRRYFDETGELSYETYLLKAGLSEGLAPYRDEKTKKYGYVNESGAWVIAPAFDVAEKFEDGYAVVQNEITLADGTKDVEWGIIRNPNR
ncbi:WG repeat-containing protein [Anaerotignum faecicola]|nr:WG repeat-containing protein [Anaerotignum faecicola]